MKPYPLRKISKLMLLLLSGIISNEQLSAQQKENSQPQQFAFSAKESVDYALKNSVDVKNALININIQEQTNREITAAAYPQLSGSVSLTDFLKIPVNLLPGELAGQPAGTFIPVQFGTKWSGNYGLNASQILFDGQVFVGLQARKSAMTYSRQSAEVTNELIKANVYKIYYSLVVSKKQMEVIDVNIERAKKLLDDTKALFQNGFAENLDIDKVNVNVSNLQTEKTKLQNQIESGYVGLKYLMGMPISSQLTLTDSVTEEQIKTDILDDAGFKFEDRKEYQLVQTAEKLGEFNIRRYRAQYIPTISLTGNYTRNAYRTTFTYFKSGTNYPWFTTAFIGLSINVPIFDGFARDARIQKAKYELQQTRNNMEGTRNNISQEIEKARISLRSAVITIDAQRNNMELAERVYNQTKLKYEQGLGSNIEIINAEGDLKIAQNNYFSAMYDAVIAKIDYQKATGKL